MKRWMLTLAAALLALAAPAVRAASLEVTPPRLEVRQHKLGNGLEVLLHEDHSAPVASVQVWYHVGAKDEKKGKSGFAHMFEHMMFKGSANVGPEEHAAFIQSIGGRYNASTDNDVTRYYQAFPSHYLERVLWMEADRMRTLDVSEANFLSERDVVKEERRARIDNPPFGRLFELVFDASYTTHPYKIPSIGTMADLDAATIEDVREFHQTYYVPNNATLVIAGDFQPGQALRWAEQHFGSIPKGKDVPRDVPAEPAQTAERRVEDYHPNTPLPAVILTYHIPEDGHADLYALDVAGNILSNGQSSRLYRSLVYEQQIALAAGGQTLKLDDPGVFFFYAILQPGRSPEDGEKALAAAAELLKNEPVSAAELEKAKNQTIAGLVFGRQSVMSKAQEIANANVVLDDVTLVNRQLALYQKVTAEDVRRVARKYLDPKNRTVVRMLPEAMRPAGQGSESPGTSGSKEANR